MPLYKYVANRALTAIENVLVGQKLSEYHTGYRAFSRRLLETLPLAENSDDFVFDNEMLIQTAFFGFNIAEVTCPTSYLPEASSIGLGRSLVYGVGVLRVACNYRLAKLGLERVRDLLEHRPRRYEAAAPERAIADLFGDDEVVIEGSVVRGIG